VLETIECRVCSCLQSGNPKGRPRGKTKPTQSPADERLKEIILQEAYRDIKVNDGDKQITVPMAQAIMRSLAVTAAKGNTRAQRLFAELLASTETSNKRAKDEWFETAIAYKQNWEDELLRRKHLNIIAPDPIPHPDDIIVNFHDGTVSIRGPMTKEDLTDLDLWLNRKNDNEAELRASMEDLEDPEYAPYLMFLKDELTHTKRILRIIDRSLAMRASPTCITRRLSQLDPKTPEYLLKLRTLKRATVRPNLYCNALLSWTPSRYLDL
jgi:hypothetical protein